MRFLITFSKGLLFFGLVSIVIGILVAVGGAVLWLTGIEELAIFIPIILLFAWPLGAAMED